MCSLLKEAAQNFNPRSPHGERRGSHKPRQHNWEISIHAPRTGSDAGATSPDNTTGRFQSTLPARGATDGRRRTSAAAKDFNPRSPHGERPSFPADIMLANHFNPRSPHGERPLPPPESAQCVSISIHAPRTGSDAKRAATRGRHAISIHAPRTGSDMMVRTHVIAQQISIHAPRTGSDGREALTRWGAVLFQSTLPARGATSVIWEEVAEAKISIHAPRTGSDRGES